MLTSNYSYSKILKSIRNVDQNSLEPIKIAVLRNIVIEPIEAPIKYFSQSSGFYSNIVFGELDNVFQDSMNEGIISSDTNVVFIVTPLNALLPKVFDRFCTLSDVEKNECREFVDAFVEGVLKNIRALNPTVPVFWLSFETPIYPSFGINDANDENGQIRFVRKLNTVLSTTLAEHKNAYLLNSDSVLNNLGGDRYYDWRYWHLSRSLYSRDALIGLSWLLQGYIDILFGKTKKCLVLDCDNTLWGGIVGEEGVSGISLGQTFPGNCFIDFQAAVLELYHKGVIIALCSKNNEEDVLEVFEKHPDMLLKTKHIAAHRINWTDKVTNLKSLASHLNIALDSIVFVDDSPFETDHVRANLPEVKTVLLNSKNPASYAQEMRSLNCFDKLVITDEDLVRGQMYVAQNQRESLRQSTDIESYLNSLNIQANIFLVDEVGVSRAAQQIQKTNQFNLTTKRYTEDEIRDFVDSNSYDVVGMRVQDRFGEMGVVATAIIKYRDNKAILDTFLLSCRALGRRLEYVFLDRILLLCRSKNVDRVVGVYRPTRKNRQTESFYKSHRFIEVDTSPLETIYELSTSDFQVGNYDYIVVDDNGLNTERVDCGRKTD